MFDEELAGFGAPVAITGMMTISWSIGLLLVLCVPINLQPGVVARMLP